MFYLLNKLLREIRELNLSFLFAASERLRMKARPGWVWWSVPNMSYCSHSVSWMRKRVSGKMTGIMKGFVTWHFFKVCWYVNKLKQCFPLLLEGFICTWLLFFRKILNQVGERTCPLYPWQNSGCSTPFIFWHNWVSSFTGPIAKTDFFLSH